jgi:hypothetical protein
LCHKKKADSFWVLLRAKRTSDPRKGKPGRLVEEAKKNPGLAVENCVGN